MRSPVSTRAALARGLAHLWRFQTTRLAQSAFAGAPAGTVLEREFAGQTLFVDVSRSYAQKRLYLEGVRYVAESNLLSALVQPGMRVVDVGANIGYYALLFRRWVGERGWVDCVEPEPSNLLELHRNVEANGLANVSVHEVAVGDGDGVVRFKQGINGRVSGDGEIEVPVRSLDSLVGEDDLVGQAVDFVKVDVEGFEGAVLDGAARVLQDYRPVLFLELHAKLWTDHTHVGILGLLQKAYSRLVVYEERRPTDALGKFSQQYLGGAAVREVEDTDVIVADWEAGRRRAPVWVVCRP